MTEPKTKPSSTSSKAPRRPLNWRLVAGVVVLLLVVVGSAAAFILSQRQQDIRQQAAVQGPPGGGGTTQPGSGTTPDLNCASGSSCITGNNAVSTCTSSGGLNAGPCTKSGTAGICCKPSGTGGTTPPAGSVCCQLVSGEYDYAPDKKTCEQLGGGKVVSNNLLCDGSTPISLCVNTFSSSSTISKLDAYNNAKIACLEQGSSWNDELCKCFSTACVSKLGSLENYTSAKSVCYQKAGSEAWSESSCNCSAICCKGSGGDYLWSPNLSTCRSREEGLQVNDSFCPAISSPSTPSSGGSSSGTGGSSSGTGGSTPSTGACAGVLQKCDSQACCGGQNLVCTGVQGSRVCNQTGGNLCPGSNQCGGAGGYIGFRCASTTGGASGTECLENPQTFDTWEAAYSYATSGSQQGLPNNCGQVDEVCVGGSNNRNLCGSFVIINSGCSGGGGGQTPAPSSTPVGPQCKRIEMQDNTSSQALTQPKSGQTVKFLCGLPQDAEDSRIHHFVFRVIEPDGNIVNLNAVSQKARQSVPYTVPGKTGQYFAQCQICTGASTCLPYEAYKQTAGTSGTSNTGSMNGSAETSTMVPSTTSPANQLTGSSNTSSRDDAAAAAAEEAAKAAAQETVKPLPAGPMPAQDDLGTTPARTTSRNTGPFGTIYNSVSSLWGGTK